MNKFQSNSFMILTLNDVKKIFKNNEKEKRRKITRRPASLLCRFIKLRAFAVALLLIRFGDDDVLSLRVFLP